VTPRLITAAMHDLLLQVSSSLSNWIDLKFRQPTSARLVSDGSFKAPDALAIAARRSEHIDGNG
jgi:hypothetical protein